MAKNDPAPLPHVEARWVPALALIGVYVLLRTLPDRITLLPPWIGEAATASVLVAMAAVAITHGRPLWLRIEHGVITVMAYIYIAITAAEVTDMVGLITIHPSGTNAFSLLSSSLAIWMSNVLVFSLLFWQVDRDGPRNRASGSRQTPDWVFPQPSSPDDLAAEWQPQYVDHLFLAFNTSTAFSPTDAAPLTRRAKVLMMVESAISLLTMVVVVSRAINALPA